MKFRVTHLFGATTYVAIWAAATAGWARYMVRVGADYGDAWSNAQAPYFFGFGVAGLVFGVYFLARGFRGDYMIIGPTQAEFDITIGNLDRVLSLLVLWGKQVKGDGPEAVDLPNRQTLKHHAEDMIAAGQKILKDLGEIEGTPQPS